MRAFAGFLPLLGIATTFACATPPPPPKGPEPILVAVTVDDLPRHGADVAGKPPLAIARELLAVFKKHGIRQAYGFVNGKKIETHSEDLAVLKAWADAGQPLGNHTYSHADAEKLSAKDFIAEIDAGEAILVQLAKPSAKPFERRVFRYPFLREGDTIAKRDEIRLHLRQKGYRIAQVTVDTWDWAYGDAYARCLQKNNTALVEAIRQSVVDTAKATLRYADAESHVLLGRGMKHILLLHLGAADADVMDELLSAYEKMNVQWISLDDALGDEAYAVDPRVTDTWTFLSQLREMRHERPPPFPFPPQKLLAAMCK
jgi:peptidoglycan/xylan/chitin deacetylase (PgdA/CDA1 family)